jgi:subtilisin family serine protease
LGIAGVSWKSRIVPVRTHDSDGQAPNTRVALGIKTMATASVRVANMSISSNLGSLTLCNAIEDLQAAGALAVAAAGNQGASDKRYPAACSGVIAVANLNSADQRVASSNWGGWVTLAAPGNAIISTVPKGSCSLCDPSGYSTAGGTSMAAPLVAGVASLVAGRDSSFTAKQIRDILVNTTIPITTDKPVGRGLVNAVEAVFNGNFESNFTWWTYTGAAGIISQIGKEVAPANGNRMAALYAGGYHPTDETILRQSFVVQTAPYARPRLRVRLAMFGPNSLKYVANRPRLSISVGRDNVFTLLGAIESDDFSQKVTGVSTYYDQAGASWTGWKTFEFDLPGDFAGPAQLRIRMYNENGLAATGLVDFIQVL